VAVYQVPLQEAIRVTGATCSAVGLYQRLGRLRKRNARLEEDSARGFDLQRQQQASVCAQEVETEHASVRVQEADETDCPKTSSGLNGGSDTIRRYITISQTTNNDNKQQQQTTTNNDDDDERRQ
jgi:hypothetical protein